MGVLCFGLTVNAKMALGCGVVVTAWGFLQILIYMKWPEYFEQKEKYQP